MPIRRDSLGHYDLDPPRAVRVQPRAWRRAVESAPQDAGVRDRCSRWLEQQERYEEAIPEVEWLRQQTQGGGRPIQDRLDAARHGLKLKKGIESR